MDTNLKPWRVLVCGGRAYKNREYVHRILNAFEERRWPIRCLIHGCAGKFDRDGRVIQGADLLAAEWMQGKIKEWIKRETELAALENRKRKITHGFSVIGFPADWSRFGPAAGPRRNTHMLMVGKPDVVIAFPGGPGTANMIQQAMDFGKEVIKCNE